MSNSRQLQLQLDDNRHKIDVDNFDVTLRELLTMSEKDELKRAPSYQRQFRWAEEDESSLIESLLLGLPVPNIFVAANKNGTWELVDGLQRVSTILHFMATTQELLQSVGQSHNLVLVGLKTLTLFNGLTFQDLPTPLQLGLQKRGLRLTALSDKSDPKVRYDMFERLNKGGVSLTPQEIRNCVYRGPFNDLLKKLGEHPNFRKLVKLQKVHQNDGTLEELALKYFAYKNYGEAFTGAVAGFLNDSMLKLSSKSPGEIEALRVEFCRVCDELVRVIKGPILREGYHVTPQNQLEAIMVAAGTLLARGKQLVKPPKGWLNDDELVKFSTKGTNTKPSLTGRINRAKELLSGK